VENSEACHLECANSTAQLVQRFLGVGKEDSGNRWPKPRHFESNRLAIDGHKSSIQV
jgi:hypothetical protein